MGPRESSYHPEIWSTGAFTLAMFVVTACARQYASRVGCAIHRSQSGTSPHPSCSGSSATGRWSITRPISSSFMLWSVRARMRHAQATSMGEKIMSS